MRTLLSLCLALVTLQGGVFAAAPVNFKLQSLIDSSNEGPDRPRSYITMGSRRISFRVPPFCRTVSEPGSLSICLDKAGQNGEFSVVNSTIRTDVDFLAQTEVYYKAAEATLPKEAEAVEFKGSRNDLYAVNEWKSIAFGWTYTLLGKTMHRQVAFINIDPEHQIRLTILADEESAKAAVGTALGFMKSWYWADGINGTYK